MRDHYITTAEEKLMERKKMDVMYVVLMNWPCNSGIHNDAD